MTSRDAIRAALASTQDILKMYLSDLSDADLLVRPVPNANHIAWQIGHLISAERGICRILPGVAYSELPSGWEEQHDKNTAAQEPPRGFATKAAYLDLFDKTRGATLAALDKMSDADLDRPTEGNMAKFAPTLGALLVLTANHTMMHAGQFTVVRRKLGKPVLF
jgi:uncharacterized damage-inducible protein DinB